MALQLSKALSNFQLADVVELDCGSFDLAIRQAAVHNEKFRASIAKRSLASKKKSLVPERGTITGSIDEDVALIVDHICVGWGERPLLDDEGEEVPFTKENLRELFTSSQEGRVLFSKVQQAAVDDELFVLREEDLKNS